MKYRVYVNRFGGLELLNIVTAKSCDEAISLVMDKRGFDSPMRHFLVAKRQKAGAK